MRGWLPAVLVLALAMAPLAGAATSERLALWGHWADDVDEALEEPMPMRTLYPHGAEDLDEGPTAPGSEAAGTAPMFTFQGPSTPHEGLRVVDEGIAQAQIFLSADQAPDEPTGQAPQDGLKAGVAPEVTVEVRVTANGIQIARGTTTHTLVTADEAPGEPVTRYVIDMEPSEARIPTSGQLTATFAVHQTEHPDRLTQPGFKVHTGEAYPTVVTVPLEGSEGGASGGPLSAASIDADPQEVRSTATGVLVAAIAMAAVAGARLVSMWWRR